MDQRTKNIIKRICGKNAKKYQHEIRECNILKVFHIEENEIRHSNFLGYLFDEEHNGCIKKQFVNRFVKEVIKDNAQQKEFLETNCEVHREYKNTSINKSQMDLLIVFPNVGVIAVENKVKAEESSTQLDEYYDLAKDKASGMKNPDPILILLSPDGRGTQYARRSEWQPLSYKAIQRMLIEINMNKGKTGKYRDENRRLINDYLEVLEMKVIKDGKRKEEFDNYQDCINDPDVKNSVEEISKYVKNREFRGLLVNQYFGQRSDMVKTRGDIYDVYIDYHPKEWEVKQNGTVVKGVITITNGGKTKSNLTLNVGLYWEDDKGKIIGKRIRDYFKTVSSRYGLTSSSQNRNTGANNYNKSCSLGYTNTIISDTDKRKRMTEAEKCADMLERLNDFFKDNGEEKGDYYNLSSFFSNCKTKVW